MARLFARGRNDVLIQQVLRQVEQALLEFQSQGADLSQLRLKKYQKTHFVNCTCAKCQRATRKGDPQARGLLEDGYKLYIPIIEDRGE